MNDQTDQQLLRAYTRQKSEAAFAAIVHRYIDLVYSAALRLSCDPHAAKDVTQSVFVALAQNAPQLTDRPALAGWLHGTARNLAVKTIRSDSRRRSREQEAAVMNELLSTESDVAWEQVAPHLDDAMAELDDTDRDAVLLRYFKNHDLRTVGATLGISDDAAQKRVSRAVERLREFFAKRGVTVGASGLAVVISANAVQAAPVGLALTISTAAVLTGTTLATTATITATKAIAMTAFQKTLVTATIAVLAGAGIYEARQAAQLREQVQTLQQQQALVAEQIQQLQSERDEATKRLADISTETAQNKNDNTELLRLRGKVATLSSAATQMNDRTAENEDLKMQINELKGRWYNVTNSPAFSMPYVKRDQWSEIRSSPDDPMGILLAAAAVARDNDQNQLSGLLGGKIDSGAAAQFSPEKWADVLGVQIVSTDYLTMNGEQTATVDTILMKRIDATNVSGEPPALTELVNSHPVTSRWRFLKTETGWRLMGKN